MRPITAKILDLTIENYKSFLTPQTINFSRKEGGLYPITALFGFNATGKSNTSFALSSIQSIIRNSSLAGYALPYTPFMYQTSSRDKATSFAMTINFSGLIFKYAFSYNREYIEYEELKQKSANSNKYKVIFIRNKSEINPGATNYGFGRGLMKRTRPNTLLITKAEEDNNPYASVVFQAINGIKVIIDDGKMLENEAMKDLYSQPELLRETIEIMRTVDSSIKDIRIEKIQIPEALIKSFSISEDAKQALRSEGNYMVQVGHFLRDGKNPIKGNAGNMITGNDIFSESMGTRKLFGMAVPIIKSIKSGQTLYIDEFGAYLHPALSKKIIQLYRENDNSANLVLNTHSDSILDELEYCNVYMVEKDSVIENTSLLRLPPINRNKRRKEYRRWHAGIKNTSSPDPSLMFLNTLETLSRGQEKYYTNNDEIDRILSKLKR